MSGFGELGKSPLWSHLEGAQKELGQEGFRVDARKAAGLAASLGITHAAVGEVRRSGGRYTLSYRVIDLSTGKAAGSPVSTSGSEAAVVAALPKVARALASRMGVKPVRILAAPAETATDLQRLGRMPWIPDETLPEEQARELASLSRKSPLAGMLYLLNRADLRDEWGVRETIDQLSRQAPDHPLVRAEAGRQSNNTHAGSAPAPVPSLKARFANNALVNLAEAYYYRERAKFPEARKAGEQAVRCSVRSPNVWLSLSTSYYQQADAIRNGRYTTQLTRAELDYCQKLYELWLQAALRATQLDPHDSLAWSDLSSAAAFGGESGLADTAFWKALALDPDSPSTLQWGLDLYDAKWLGDPRKAEKVARMAVDASIRAGDRWSRADRLETARSVAWLGHPDLAQRIIRPGERAELKRLVAEAGAPGK
jgi:tetratricopeptide (TPR) repeat protein